MSVPSHYSSVGFHFDSSEEFREFTESVAEEGVPVETRRGSYLRWTSDSGAELWLQVDREHTLVGAHPHYAGKSEVRIRATARVKREDDTDRASTGEVKWASRSFLPSGLFSDAKAPATAHALFTGHVLECEEKQNAQSGAAFFWALVDAYGGTYDVVADATIVETPPVPGGIVHGSFWLSGRVVELATKAGFVGRLLHRLR